MSLHIVPSTLSMQWSVSEDCTLQLNNPTDAVMLWKVRTTTPERYLVKPRHGLLPPLGSQTIFISLARPYPPVEKQVGAMDHFQVAFRSLMVNEPAPTGGDAIGDALKFAILSSGERVQCNTQKRAIPCSLAARPSSPSGSGAAASNFMSQLDQLSSQASSAAGAAISSASAAASGATLSSPSFPAPVSSSSGSNSRTVESAEAELSRLNTSISQHRSQISDNEVVRSELQQRKKALESKNTEDSVKIEQLSQKQKLERQNAPTTVPLWLVLALMAIVALIGRYYTF